MTDAERKRLERPPASWKKAVNPRKNFGRCSKCGRVAVLAQADSDDRRLCAACWPLDD